MLEINLLPDEFKQKEENKNVLSRVQLILLGVFVVTGILLLIHFCLGGAVFLKNRQYKKLKQEWARLEPQLEKVNEWRNQYKISSQQTEQMNKLLSERITVSDKMLVLVNDLPNGIWFNQLILKEKKLNIHGSVVSLNDSHVTLLNLFLGRLKAEGYFFKDFMSLELGNMKMRTLGSLSIMDFVLEGELREIK